MSQSLQLECLRPSRRPPRAHLQVDLSDFGAAVRGKDPGVRASQGVRLPHVLGGGGGANEAGFAVAQTPQKRRNSKPHLQTRMKKLQLVKKQLLLT